MVQEEGTHLFVELDRIGVFPYEKSPPGIALFYFMVQQRLDPA
jgi:hypothetical protein